jgi:hypothetical protein
MHAPIWAVVASSVAVGFSLGVVVAFKFAGACVGLAVKELVEEELLKKGGSE